MLTLAPPLPPAEQQALATLGRELRALGYTAGPVARALGILAWNGPDMDGEWWARDNLAEGRLGALVDLFIRGAVLPRGQAEQVLPPSAWAAGVLVERRGDVHVDGIVLPLGEDLVWTDRGDRSFLRGGLFLPDSTTLELRRCIPPGTVDRHLDLGCGGGAITVAAARRARTTLGVEINPRGALAVQRTVALSGVEGVSACTGEASEAAGLAPFDRISFVLPLLVPWQGMAQAGPIHTISATSDLLQQVLSLLPGLLAPGGLALLYTQDWVGGPTLPQAIDEVMQGRSWRGAYWWDLSGTWRERTVRTGCLAIRADAAPGWAEAQNDAPDEGVSDWWPWLAALLGEAPA